MPLFSPGRSDRNAETRETTLAAWFGRAGRLARSINAGQMTLDEATDQLAGTCRNGDDIRALRRAEWDAETMLGTDAVATALLRAAREQCSRQRNRAFKGDIQRQEVCADTSLMQRDSAPAVRRRSSLFRRGFDFDSEHL
jgi:hypothetical protein